MNPHPPTPLGITHLSFREEEASPASVYPRAQDRRRNPGIHLVGGRAVGAERSAAVVMARQVMRSIDRCSSALMALAADLTPSKLPVLVKLAKARAGASTADVSLASRLLDLQQMATLLDKEMAARHRLEAELHEAGALLQRMRTELVHIQTHAERTEQLAYQDALTGLPNRASFEIHSRRALSQHAPDSRAFGLMYIDLDGFKTVNDTHGHGVGDELLKVIGSRLAHAVRADDSVSRHGGDEFLCLLVDVQDEAQMSAIAGKLFDTVAAPCQLRSLSLNVTPSIGIALYPRDGTTIDTLLEHADSAMFWAKKHHLRHAFYRQVPAGDKPRPLDGVSGLAKPDLHPWPALDGAASGLHAWTPRP